MIKIGIECENLEDPKSRWGIGKITLNLLKEFAQNPEWQDKYKLYLYFKSRVPDDEVLKNPIFVKRVLGVPSFNIFYHILMPLRAMVDRVDWMFFPAYQLPPLYLGKSIVVLTEDAYYEYKYGSLPFRYKLSYRIFTNWAAKFATKILAISETSKKEVTKVYKINPDKIFVNYLGIEFIQNTKYEIQDTKYILFVGQMFPRRHARETILAFEKVADENPGLKLILIGPDKYETPAIDPLVAKVNERLGHNSIIYKEYVKDDELIELYAGAKALVYVSDREAFGLPPMEALSLGVPPVVMDNELGHELFGSRPEETESLFGDYAFYSPSPSIGNAKSQAQAQKENNPSEALAKEGILVDNIAETIKQALTDRHKIDKIKSEGPKFVKKYNWKSFADKFFNTITT